ncbi:MAG: hemagglutinin repeat-containing protein [Dyella sp.]|uniref:hemagglutinin repeat-containing protein n=1 Tax=Dyella sp. TaxID=1869338 RepID=UPI003F810B1B
MDSLTHTVSTVQAGGAVTLIAGQNLTSQAAQLSGSTVTLGAGHDVTLQAVTDSTTRSTDHFQNHTDVSTGQTDQTVRGTTIAGSHGVSIAANHDLTVTAGNLSSTNGNVALAAGNNLTLTAADETHSSYRDTSTHHSGLFSSDSTKTHDATSDTYAIGTAINGNNVTLAAGNNLATQAAQLTANNALSLSAVNNVTLGAGQDTHTEEHDYQHSSFNFFSDSSKRFGSVDPEWRSNQSSTTINQTTSIGSTLSGDTVTVAAGHDLTGTAVQIAGTHDVTLAAGHDLTLNAGQDIYTETQSSGTSHTGLMNGGGFSVLIGNKSQKTTTTDKEVSYTGSLVGSTNGAVTLTAGNNVHITGSDVLSQTATTIVGKNVTIDAAVGSQDVTQTQKQSSAGINVGFGGKVADAANSTYYSVQRASEVKDDRLKALYAAQAAYSAKDAVGMAGTSLGQAASENNPGGINLQVGIGGSSASSTITSHDDKAYGSHIRSAGDVNIVATGGDLNIVGSQIDGQNVALAAANNLNLLSQAENHTLHNSNKNASGGVGIQIGSDGVGFYAQASVGKGSAHGNGTTHAISTVNATDTLTLVSGNDATIKGAQLTGNTVIGTVGNNLLIQSEQDTNDYASKQQQLSGKMVIGYSSGGSLSYNQSKVNSHYQSVNDVSGISAGNGGFDIAVGGNTHLIGGVIASTADARKNILDTGSLTYESIHNEARYSASSVGISGGYGAGSSMAGNILSGVGTALSLATPQHGNSSSETQSGIAQGTINVRDGKTDLSGLDRNPTLGKEALKPIFDAQKVQENMELGQVAGQVGMRAAGDIAQYMASQATNDADRAAWNDGGINKTMLHGLVGAATAALGGGNALQGALGAMASEKASAAMQQYLDDHNITDPAQRNTLMQLASVAIGGAVGGGTGAATALQGDLYNRTLHPEYVHRLDKAAQAFADQQCAAGNCISVDEARNRLIYQSYRDQDATYDQAQAAQGKPNDAAAAAFLTGKSSGYLDPQTGQALDLSSADNNERQSPSLFANALYNDPQARAWVEQATGLPDSYLATMARQDYYSNQLPAYADRYANWQGNQTLRDMIGYGTPFGGVATAGELAYRGRYGDAAKEAGKEIAINVATAGVGKAVGKAATIIRTAIKDGKAAGEAASAAGDALKTGEQQAKQIADPALDGAQGANLSDTPSPALKDSPYNPSAVQDRIKPPYQSNPAHDTTSSLYNPSKTPEPADALSAYEDGAIRGGMGTWYAKGEGGYYRYFSDNAGTVHFSGTVPASKVPNEVLKLLGK